VLIVRNPGFTLVGRGTGGFNSAGRTFKTNFRVDVEIVARILQIAAQPRSTRVRPDIANLKFRDVTARIVPDSLEGGVRARGDARSQHLRNAIRGHQNIAIIAVALMECAPALTAAPARTNLNAEEMLLTGCTGCLDSFCDVSMKTLQVCGLLTVQAIPSTVMSAACAVNVGCAHFGSQARANA